MPETTVPGRDFRELLAMLDDHQAPELAEGFWLAALGCLERAASIAREAAHGRFSSYPQGELRRLRRNVSQALQVAELAAAVQIDENEWWHEAERETRERAAAEHAAARRRQTLPAELARRANVAARKAAAERPG